MSFMSQVTNAIANMQDSMYPMQIADSMGAMNVGMVMMHLQTAWQKNLQKDVDKINDAYVNDQLTPAQRNLTIQELNSEYTQDSSKMQSATGTFRTFFDGQKQQVTQDTENEKNFTQVQSIITSISSTTTNLIQSASRYGKH